MKTHQLALLITLLIGLLLATACSPSAAEKLNKEGNDAYAQQAYDQALALYQSAQIEEPELAEPYYNAASALYRQGQYAAALEQLQMALSFADDETLAQASFFNLGNSAYSAQDNANAIAAYTEALLRNPGDQDAKYNLELALQQQQQEQQEQEQQQNQEQQKDQQSEGGEGQEEQQNQDPSQGGEGQDEQDQQNQQQGQNGDQEQEPEQSQNGDQQQDGQQQDGDPQNQQQGQQGDQLQDQQNQQGQGQPQPGQNDPNGAQQPGVVPAPGERMSEEQARQLLAAIAGRSDTLAERLGQIFAVPWRPPAQDW